VGAALVVVVRSFALALGIPNLMRILYNTSLQIESYAFLKFIKADALLHCIPIFLKYLSNAEQMISSRAIASKSTLMIPNNILCVWN
jgi:hypothetical protein